MIEVSPLSGVTQDQIQGWCPSFALKRDSNSNGQKKLAVKSQSLENLDYRISEFFAKVQEKPIPLAYFCRPTGSRLEVAKFVAGENVSRRA